MSPYPSRGVLAPQCNSGAVKAHLKGQWESTGWEREGTTPLPFSEGFEKKVISKLSFSLLL